MIRSCDVHHRNAPLLLEWALLEAAAGHRDEARSLFERGGAIVATRASTLHAGQQYFLPCVPQPSILPCTCDRTAFPP